MKKELMVTSIIAPLKKKFIRSIFQLLKSYRIVAYHQSDFEMTILATAISGGRAAWQLYSYNIFCYKRKEWAFGKRKKKGKKKKNLTTMNEVATWHMSIKFSFKPSILALVLGTSR